MSVSYPLNNNPLPPRNENMPGDAPTKAFRGRPMPTAPVNAALARLRSLYEDRSDWNRSIIVAVLMMVIIGVSVLGKAPGTYAGLALLVISILLIAATDAWAGLLLFLVYLSLEGMFKYTTLFSTTVYAIAPCLGIYIFVTWRLATRARESKTVSEAPRKNDPLISQKGDQSIPLPPLAAYIFGFILLIFVQLFNPDAGGYVGAFAGSVVWYLAPISLLFVAYYSVRNSKQLTAFLYLTIGIGAVVSIYAMVQYFLGETWCYAHIVGLDSINRLAWFNVSSATGVSESGTFRPPSTTSIAGGYVVLAQQGIIAAIVISQMDKMPINRRVLVLALGFIMAIAMAMAGVRSVILNLIFVVPITLLLTVRSFKDTIRIYFFSFFVVAVTLMVYGVANTLTDGKIGRRLGFSVFNPFKSYQKSRGYHFTVLAEGIAARPMGIGIQRGIGNWQSAGRQGIRSDLAALADRETQWNATQADMGILGILLVAGFFVAILVKGYHYSRTIKHPRLRLATIYLLSIVISTVVGSFGSPTLQSNSVFWVTCGLLLAVPRIYIEENKYVLGGDAATVTIAPAPPGA